MKQIFIIISFCVLISCDYAKQQKELTELKQQNIDLKNKVKHYELDSLFKSSELDKNPHRIKALRIIDSLKFNDPKTLEQIEKTIEINRNDIEY